MVFLYAPFMHLYLHVDSIINQNYYDWKSSILRPQTKSRTVTFSFKQPFKNISNETLAKEISMKAFE